MIVKCESKDKNDCPMLPYCLAKLNDPTISGCGMPLAYAGAIKMSEVMVEHTVSEEKSTVVHKERRLTCRDCKWWTGERTIKGRECTNPTKQEQWSRRKVTPTCHIKESGTKACKYYEEKK